MEFRIEPTPLSRRRSSRILATAAVVVVALAVVIGVLTVNNSRPNPAVASTAASVAASNAPTPSALEAPSASAVGAAFADITLKGTGKKVARFTIPAGSPALAEGTHVGKGKFSIIRLAADGGHNAVLVNTIGNYKGTVLFGQNDDEHSVAFEIDADGAWNVVIKPVTVAQTWDRKSPLKGVSDDVVLQSPPSSGSATLDLTFAGKGHFAVTAYTSDGSDLLANETGKFTGQVRLPIGTFGLVMTGEGAWTATPG